MRADFVTYQRAAHRALMGAAIQGVMGVAFVVYGMRANDHAAESAGWYVTFGLVVWVALAIVFDQQRRERVEAIEQDALSNSAGTSVFEGSGTDFRVAARRLALMQKWLLPIVSLVFGLGLLGIGAIRYASGKPQVEPNAFPVPMYHGWAIGIGMACAIVGFLFARYIAGMAKQSAWAQLRAGAGLAVGASLSGLALAVSHLIANYGPDAVLRHLQIILPIAFMVLGAEVILNFLLDLYRPRKAGEVRHSAMDSRLLSFIAAPDRIAQSINEAINYQFGYDVSSTWFYQLLSRSVLRLILLGGGVLWLTSSFSVIEPHQRGLVLRFGAFDREIGPGLHFKAPWPIERVDVPVQVAKDERGGYWEVGRTTTGVRTLQLATHPPNQESTTAILWTNEHAVRETYFLMKPSPVVDAPASASQSGERDLALLALEMPLRYSVSDTQAYEELGEPIQREELLIAVAQRAAMRVFKNYSIDDLLGPRRPEAAPRIAQAIQVAFDGLNTKGAGVRVLSVDVMGVHPAKQVAPSFEKVVQASQGAEGMMETAGSAASRALIAVAGSEEAARALVAAIDRREQAANGTDKDAQRKADAEIYALLADCKGTVAATLARAKAERWAKHMSERSRALRYMGLVQSYEANEDLFRAHAYFDALSEALNVSRLVITDDTIGTFRINADLLEHDGGSGAFEVLNDEAQQK